MLHWYQEKCFFKLLTRRKWVVKFAWECQDPLQIAVPVMMLIIMFLYYTWQYAIIHWKLWLSVPSYPSARNFSLDWKASIETEYLIFVSFFIILITLDASSLSAWDRVFPSTIIIERKFLPRPGFEPRCPAQYIEYIVYSDCTIQIN